MLISDGYQAGFSRCSRRLCGGDSVTFWRARKVPKSAQRGLKSEERGFQPPLDSPRLCNFLRERAAADCPARLHSPAPTLLKKASIIEETCLGAIVLISGIFWKLRSSPLHVLLHHRVRLAECRFQRREEGFVALVGFFLLHRADRLKAALHPRCLRQRRRNRRALLLLIH